MSADLFNNPHVSAALYFIDQGHYLFKYKKDAGQVVSKNLREPEVLAAFTRSGTDSGWLQDGIMRAGNSSRGNWFVYAVEPTKVEIQIGQGEPITVPIPATVLVGIGHTFHLFALAARQFHIGAEVFAAPFPNVYPDGRICWGQNAAPKADAGNARSVWELFFRAPFNGDLAQGKSTKFKDDIRKQYALLAGKKNYPVKTLVSLRVDISRQIEKLTGIKR